MIDLIKFLKFRLPKWKNEKFWKVMSSKRRDGYEWHHLLGRKYSDLFVVLIPVEQHKKIHTQGYSEDEFETLFIQSIINIQEYINNETHQKN